MQASRDAGKAWSDPRVLAATTDASDHPLLIKRTGVVYLSWLTHEQGYRLLPLQTAATRREIRIGDRA